jgi:hypothetical protein
MTAEHQDITVYQGQENKVTIPVTDAGGAPIDLTGSTRFWHLYHHAGEDTALIAKTPGIVTVAPGTNNALEFTLTGSELADLPVGEYWHEAFVINSSGQGAPVSVGSFFVRPSPHGRTR